MERIVKARIGTITGSEVRKFRDSPSNSRMLNTEISSPDDVQSVELIMGQGEDINPEDSDKVLVMQLTDAYKMGLIVDDGIEPDESLEKGEKEFYSKEGGVKKAKIKLNKDGEVILNEGLDFAVKFLQLQTKLSALEAQLIAHVHPGVTAGAASTAPSVTVFDIDISSSKVEKVRL